MLVKVFCLVLIGCAAAVDDQCVYDQEECPCFARANVATVVDTTGSIRTAGDYPQMKTFLKKVIGRLGLGDNGIITSGISFANDAILQWPFGSSTSINHPEICAAIDNLPAPKGQTNTHLAINMAQSQLMMPLASDRTWACNVVLLVTDGGSDVKSALTTSIADIRAAVPDVKFCVVSIRQDDESDAQKENRDKEIAKFVGTNGQNMDASGFANLDALVEATMDCICCPCEECQADVMFLVDRTGSIGTSGEFNDMKSFINDLLQGLSAYDITTALASFSSAVKMEWSFADNLDAGAAASFVNAIAAPKGQTYTHLALSAALAELEAYGRSGVPQRVVLITDGGSDNKKLTTEAALLLQAKGVKVCLVSIRSDSESPAQVENRNKEIAKIIGADGENFDALGFSDLAGLVTDVVGCIC